MRLLSYAQAVNEAQAQAMEQDPRVMVMGLGVPGPTGVFGTTEGLVERFGSERVLDTPSSEDGMTGVALGATLSGVRPVMVHMRVDFAVLAMNQMVNQVAKWRFMYGGKLSAPMVFRMIVGRGWGQGPQHSQSLQAWFAHTPGLKVIAPATPRDAKGMLIAAIRDDAPVVVIEHRWLYGVEGDVPEAPYETPLDRARIARPGRDLTIAATSYMVIEALRAAEILSESYGLEAEVLDLRCLAPFDIELLRGSVSRTGALIAADTGVGRFGASAEIIAVAAEALGPVMRAAPRRVALPFAPSPTSPSLADAYFPRARQIVEAAVAQLGLDAARLPPEPPPHGPWRDTPDPSFTGPY